MKKRIVIVSISIILVILLIIGLANNSDKTMKINGVRLAMTLDGDEISSFPSGNYHVNITASNVTCEYLYDTSEGNYKLSFKNIQSGAKCELDFTSNPDPITTVVEGVATNEGTAGYRFEGENPNNYVWFNNEMWRIIGSIPTKISSSNTSNLVKIIKNESIGGLVWHTSSSSLSWNTSTLYTLLNSYYYGKQNGNNTNYCYGAPVTAKAKCDYRQIGISSNANDFYGRMVANVYWNIGKADPNQTVGTMYSYESSYKDYQSRVGLMNTSDYGYAASYGRTTLEYYGTADYTGSNWLFTNGYEWTFTPGRDNANSILYITETGSVNYGSPINGYKVRPVVYLDSSVYVVSGDGSEANPYKLGKP